MRNDRGTPLLRSEEKDRHGLRLLVFHGIVHQGLRVAQALEDLAIRARLQLAGHNWDQSQQAKVLGIT